MGWDSTNGEDGTAGFDGMDNISDTEVWLLLLLTILAWYERYVHSGIPSGNI